MNELGATNRGYFRIHYLNPLIRSEMVVMTNSENFTEEEGQLEVCRMTDKDERSEDENGKK